MQYLSPEWTLLFGIIISQIIPYNDTLQKNYKKLSSNILKFSVILLGASLNFYSIINQGQQGALITFFSISFVFINGYLLNKVYKLTSEQNNLITMGTAICGGSAIGALAPAIKATSVAIAVSMGVVFLLNALAVFIFPPLGHYFNLSQIQFGTWAALAIHDTSSVVAASSLYGEKALEIGTSIKLTRALWIIPITMIFSFAKNKTDNKKLNIPWFIAGFLALSLTFTFIAIPQEYKDFISQTAKYGFSLTLFLIGLTFHRKMLKEVGLRPFLFGITLWLTMSISSFIFVKYFI